jgi:hypothetical protein
MPNHPINRPNGRRPAWRVLLFDRSDATDPLWVLLWVLCTVAALGDVRPAGVGDTPDDVTAAWAAGQGTLTPWPHVRAWRIDR